MNHHKTVRVLIEQVAERLSYARRVEQICCEHQQHLDRVEGLPSSKEQMQGDWHNACLFVALKVIENDIDLTKVEPASYPLLEEAWLSDVTRLRAYYIWKSGNTEGPERDYYTAAKEIRQRLINSSTEPLGEFSLVRRYLMEKFLSEDGELDDQKPSVNMMLAVKAKQLHETTNNTDSDSNWFGCGSFGTRLRY
ncbi:MAG: hypothetical protein D3910_27025 [Candidatus Electrothrix sp. ATG2]|nr:hypothetical protein [Candidatus Electrothrix sp. ATG2]